MPLRAPRARTGKGRGDRVYSASVRPVPTARGSRGEGTFPPGPLAPAPAGYQRVLREASPALRSRFGHRGPLTHGAPLRKHAPTARARGPSRKTPAAPAGSRPTGSCVPRSDSRTGARDGTRRSCRRDCARWDAGRSPHQAVSDVAVLEGVAQEGLVEAVHGLEQLPVEGEVQPEDFGTPHAAPQRTPEGLAPAAARVPQVRRRRQGLEAPRLHVLDRDARRDRLREPDPPTNVEAARHVHCDMPRHELRRPGNAVAITEDQQPGLRRAGGPPR